jgi:hypothetical protein
MRAAALLEEAFPTHVHHPGVLHYLIHSYDDPVHAPLGLRAARLYGAVAPEAPHALHMTSHIFIALGMWDEVIEANINAMRAENAREIAQGQPAAACFHYEEWLVYGHLQKGDVTRADDRIAACWQTTRTIFEMRPQRPRFYQAAMQSYSDMLVRRAVETGEWSSDLATQLDDDARLETRINLAYGEALTAVADPARMQAVAGRLHDLVTQLERRPATPGSEAQQAQVLRLYKVMDEEIAALALIARGDADGGLAALRLAAEHELAVPQDFGPPAIPKPTLELLGDLLLASGRPVEAEDAYRRALARTPGRRMTMLGLARAQAAAAAHPSAEASTVPQTANAPTTDIDGEARWDHPGHSNVVSIVDIGADEFVDTDLDNMADHWETEEFGSVTNRNGTADADSDALDDLAEYENGTTPANSAHPGIAAVDSWQTEQCVSSLCDVEQGCPQAVHHPSHAHGRAGEWDPDQKQREVLMKWSPVHR